MTDLLYQHSDNVISVPIVDDVTGEAIPASSFSDAEYIIYNYKYEPVVRLTLGSGISVTGDNFEIRIDDAVMTSDFLGPHFHQLVVWNGQGDKLPPVFNNKVEVVRVAKFNQ